VPVHRRAGTAAVIMSGGLLYAFAGVVLLALGLHALVVHAHLLRKILAVNVMGSGVFLVLVGLAQRDGSADPVSQAMVLTGIVVAVSATALALVLMRRLFDLSGATTLDETD
jgi:multicomponent Na+:H+ antiporter subunit C